MVRSELVQKLALENPTLTTREIDMIVTIFFDQISQTLADGGRAELRGFGIFSTRTRKSRAGRNPRTGSTVDVPTKAVPFFKAGKELRSLLNM